jgi:hypothetical protein
VGRRVRWILGVGEGSMRAAGCGGFMGSEGILNGCG